MLDHMILTVSNVERSLAFYEAAFRRRAPNRRSNFSQPDFAGTLKNPANTLA